MKIFCEIWDKIILEDHCLLTTNQTNSIKSCSECLYFKYLQIQKIQTSLEIKKEKGIVITPRVPKSMMKPDRKSSIPIMIEFPKAKKVDTGRFATVYVHFPPKGPLSKKQLIELRLAAPDKILEAFDLSCRSKFDEGDKLSALDCFEWFIKKNCYPPGWVLGWLYLVFSKYKRQEGARSLEELMGFRKPGSGNQSLFRKRDELKKNIHISLQVEMLTCAGLKPGEAVELVADKYYPGFSIGRVSNICSKMRKEQPEWFDTIREWVDKMDDQGRKNFIKSYKK